MSSFTVAASLENYLQASADKGWEVLPNIMGGIGEVFAASIGLYLVVVLLSYMWTGQASQLPIMDLFKRFFFMALVCAFAFNGDNYIAWVKEPVLSIPNDIASFFSSSGETSASTIDTMMNNNLNTLFETWGIIGQTKFWNLSFMLIFEVIVASIVILVLGTVYVILAFSYLMVAKVLINVLLIIGPIFIAFSLFSATKEYFMKWVGQLLNYIFLVVIFTAVFTFLNEALMMVISSHEGVKTIGAAGLEDSLILKLLFMYLLFIAVIMAVPTLASSLTGGVGISPFGQVAQLATAGKAGMLKALGGGRALSGLLNRGSGSIGGGKGLG